MTSLQRFKQTKATGKVMAHKSIPILQGCSVYEYTEGRKKLPHNAIHAELCDPFTKISNPHIFLRRIVRARFSPYKEVLCIQ